MLGVLRDTLVFFSIVAGSMAVAAVIIIAALYIVWRINGRTFG